MKSAGIAGGFAMLLLAATLAPGCQHGWKDWGKSDRNKDEAARAPSASVAKDVHTHQITVDAYDFRFEPSTIRVHPGDIVKLTLVNEGDAPHNIEFELDGEEVEFDSSIQPGNRRTMTFPAPQKKGEYRLYCPVGQHAERGMTGKLIVE